MAYFKALSEHLPRLTGKYDSYLVTLFLQPVSLFVSSLLELSVHIIYFQLCYQEQHCHMLVIRY
jgi:hypothetical protein